MRAIAIFVHITHLYYLIYAFAAYVSKNKVIKSGVCPRTTGASTTVCNTNCQIDYDCHGIKKCCQVNACSTRCTRPVLVDVGGSGSSTIFDRGTILDTRGSVVGGISRGGHETFSVESSKRIIKTSSSGKRLTHGGNRIGTESLFGNNGRSSSIIEKVGLGRRSDFTDSSPLHDIGRNLMTRLNAGRVSDRSSGSSSFVAESASAAANVATGHLSGDDGFTNNCQYECGIDKQCGNGYVCVQNGCHSNCEVVIKSRTNREMSGQRLHNLETINRSMGGNRHGRVGVIGGNDDFSNSRTGISRGAGSSVMEKIELERSAIKSGGLSSGISERHITHGSSIATGHLSGDDGLTSNCHYECGQDKLCIEGYTCVQHGCHSICQVGINSGVGLGVSGQNVGHISNLKRRIGATSLGEFEVIDRTRRVSSQGTVDLQDDIPTVQIDISSNLQKVNNKSECRKQCYSDADCTNNRSCMKVGCHMICRRRQVTNGYT